MRVSPSPEAAGSTISPEDDNRYTHAPETLLRFQLKKSDHIRRIHVLHRTRLDIILVEAPGIEPGSEGTTLMLLRV